jgi:tetratricopeptide (TPR) repeat protein
MAHSLDWGQYGFLQLGDYAMARKAVDLFDEMATFTGHRRAQGAGTLAKARYIIETEEWKVQPVADDASSETLLANGMSAVHLGDMRTAEQMVARLAARAGAPASAAAGGGAHADHGGAPPAPPAPGGIPDSAKSPRVMHRELAALVKLKSGASDEAVALLKEAVEIEESMRPPNGAADPVKPAHELLGEVLLELGRPAEAAVAFDACLLRMPKRARSLMGAARAHAAAGNRELAEERYNTLTSFWKGRAIARPTTDAP